MIQIDMPMPDNCLECRFNTSEFGYCNAMPVEFVGQVSDFEEDGKPEWCPLKAQEPREPVVDIDTWKCGKCGHTLEHQELLGDNVLFHEQYNYCPECGQAVKWE